MSDQALIAAARIERTILRLRGHNIMLDADLARLYGVTTKRFNEQVKRNAGRFPADFMFQLTQEEYADLRSHIATSSATGHGGRRHLPYVFTEHGAIMAAKVLNSPRAVQANQLHLRQGVAVTNFDRHLPTPPHAEAAKLAAATLPAPRSPSEGGKELGYGG